MPAPVHMRTHTNMGPYMPSCNACTQQNFHSQQQDVTYLGLLLRASNSLRIKKTKKPASSNEIEPDLIQVGFLFYENLEFFL